MILLKSLNQRSPSSKIKVIGSFKNIEDRQKCTLNVQSIPRKKTSRSSAVKSQFSYNLLITHYALGAITYFIQKINGDWSTRKNSIISLCVVTD